MAGDAPIPGSPGFTVAELRELLTACDPEAEVRLGCFGRTMRLDGIASFRPDQDAPLVVGSSRWLTPRRRPVIVLYASQRDGRDADGDEPLPD